MPSGNPFLKENRFNRLVQDAVVEGGTMTLRGTLNKTGILFIILLAGAALTWVTPGWEYALPPMWPIVIGLTAGLILAIITSFKPGLAMITAPVYAFCEGLVLGGVSSMYEFAYSGIVFQSVVITFALFAGVYITYRSGLIKVSSRFRNGVVGATLGIALFYGVMMLMSMFGVSMPFIYEGGTIGIVISLAIVVIATMNLVLDFDMINTLSQRGTPQTFEWYGAFSLIVTLVWLYLEILRLLATSRK
jgi:uncharacterized YccA/Bax inhibitor family protein